MDIGDDFLTRKSWRDFRTQEKCFLQKNLLVYSTFKNIEVAYQNGGFFNYKNVFFINLMTSLYITYH